MYCDVSHNIFVDFSF